MGHDTEVTMIFQIILALVTGVLVFVQTAFSWFVKRHIKTNDDNIGALRTNMHEIRNNLQDIKIASVQSELQYAKEYVTFGQFTTAFANLTSQIGRIENSFDLKMEKMMEKMERYKA